MTGQTAAQDSYDLAALLYCSDLDAKARRAVYDVVVNSVIEGDKPSRESVLRLIEFAAGRITIDDYKSQVLSALTPQHKAAPGDD